MNVLIDPMTGLESAQFFRQVASARLEQRESHFQPFLLVYSRLTEFAEMRINYEISFIDEVIVHLAHNARSLLRQGDHLARLGNDHFSYLVSASTLFEGEKFLERLVSCYRSLKILDLSLRVEIAHEWIASPGEHLGVIESRLERSFRKID